MTVDQRSQSPAILIVDDEPDIVTLLKIFLHDVAPTYAVLTASDAQGALRHLADHIVPLLITDYMMPGMTGLQLTAAVKAASPATYVLVVTAYGAAALEQWAQDSQVDRFLAKEGMFDHLGDVVRSVLRPAADGT